MINNDTIKIDDHLRNLSATNNGFKNFDHIRQIRTYRFVAKMLGVPCAFVAM
ncbi:hypothetical protein GCM10011413_15080 [Pedobacter psychrotolerans]|uniref:Uncharacterized protein n=1 Tax=Pedobacter psychrotolerans TaxID=1843235 RepID=A0ABQ1SQA2_9SPHI|nr:hypothetical protein GCM10011413_15080 [Pedobacter psychrotolerans]